ncbi:MAG TPA: PHB depolymerase family esterase [Caulobacteraceae bacterium]|jgi:poly(3-hydroxybutyrate) depolymerase
MLKLAAIMAVLAGALAVSANDEVAFNAYTPLSSNLELARRLSTPLTAAKLNAMLATSGKALREQPVDLAQERFALYVPPTQPPQGYALMVFVSPFETQRLPDGWRSTLDRYGVIFVAAQKSGNAQSVFGRREPLALLAAANVMAQYKVDPDRVFVSGFSGGSRVAMHLALGYPDLFRGAVLNAGSDPIGDSQAPLPPKALLAQFQARSRLVYVTGDKDTVHVAWDAASEQAMKRNCVFDLDAEITPGAGHDLMSGSVLAHALQELFAPQSPDPKRLADCQAGQVRAMTADLDQVEALIIAGKRDEATKRLQKADERWGGLAAPRSVALSKK